MEKIKEIDPIKEITLKVWREQISVTTGVAQLQALFDKRVEGIAREIEVFDENLDSPWGDKEFRELITGKWLEAIKKGGE